MKRILMVAGLPFSVTIFVLSYFSPIVVAVGATIGVIINYLWYQNKTMLVIIIISIVFAFNITANYKQNVLFDTAKFDSLSGSITAKVLDKELSNSGKTTAYTIEVLDSDIGLPTGFNGILYANFEVDVDYYDVIQVNMVCKHIESNKGFDYSTYFQSMGILMQFYSFATPTIIERNNYTLSHHIKSLNETLCNIFDQHFASYYSSMLKAMLLGNNRDLDDTLSLNANLCGLSHIFVVSGLHIALLVGIFNSFFNFLKLPYQYKSIQNTFLILLTWFLVLLTGFKISTVRAGIMMTFMLSANFFERRSDGLNSLFGAVILILAPSPYAIHSLSFQLSFSATLGIILLSKRFKLLINNCLKYEEKLPTFIDYILDCTCVTLSASIGMFPALLISFKGISAISILANLLVIPFIPVVLTCGILLLVFNSNSLIAGFIGSITLVLLFIIKTITNFLAGFRFAYLGLNSPIVWLYLMAVCIILIVAIILNIRNKLFMIKFLTLFSVATFVSTYVINFNTLTITTFSDFNSSSIVLSNRSSATIITFDDYNNSNYSINTYLQSKNIINIDNNINSTENNYKDESYRVFDKNESYLDYYNNNHGYYVKGEISNIRILITNSVDLALEMAMNEEYDILFIDASYNQDISNLNKQVFYLNENITIKFKL